MKFSDKLFVMTLRYNKINSVIYLLLLFRDAEEFFAEDFSEILWEDAQNKYSDVLIYYE